MTSEALFVEFPSLIPSDGVRPCNGTRLDAQGLPIWTDLFSAGWQTPFDCVELFLSANAEIFLANGNVYDCR